MKESDFYRYLIKARRDLWQFLEDLPDEILGQAVLNGRFHSIKDLLFHIAVVEDSWFHEDIQNQPVWQNFPGYPQMFEAGYHQNKSLQWLFNYHQTVEKASIEFLESDLDINQQISLQIRSVEHKSFLIKDILWHVMQHEVRHSAQIVLLTRLLGFDPPQLDLIRYV